MESTDVARIAAAVLVEYGVPLSVGGVSSAPPWIVSLTDIRTGRQRLIIDIRCDGTASAYRLRESIKAKLDVGL
jgi:hypothetical protein